MAVCGLAFSVRAQVPPAGTPTAPQPKADTPAMPGPSGQPVWYVATLEYAGAATDGTLNWTGDLCQTSGPWFGTFWNPLLYTRRKVGTATFFDLHVETSGIVGRYTGVDLACRFDGNIGGYSRL